jgi:ABC-2 type transport system ATP-binding protein
MISISHLSKNFGAKRAVDDLSLEVPPGELFCFLGPNGAGKTTTIKILTGLLRPLSGSAKICGLDIFTQPQEVKRVIGYIPDMPYLYDRLTTTEFFQFTGDLYDVPREKVQSGMEHYFSLFSLNEYRSALIKELSHGLRQRLVYSATLLHEPRVLFIDEPLVGLDPYTIRLIKDLLRARSRSGMTIFLTTHILALAEDIGDRIGIINNGRLITLGSVPDLLRDNQSRNLEEAYLKLTGAMSPKEESL